MDGYKNIKIIDKKEWGHSYFSLFCENDYIVKNFQPGNFLMVKGTEYSPFLLPRPFSAGRIFKNKNIFEIFFQSIGKGTEYISKKKIGDKIQILGPLGNIFPLQTKKKIIMVAGGRGISPFLSLSKILFDKGKKFNLIYGGKTVFDLKLKDYLSKYKTTFITENGSFGEKGLATDYLPEGNYHVLCCGPDIMMKKIYFFYKNSNSDIYASLEERMACGIGICYGCTRQIKNNNGYKPTRICQHGPVFNAKNIKWDE